jgi:putative SOS response-associated peptidase YedK
MCGRFALYGPISLRRDMKPEEWDWLLPLVDRIEHRPPRFNFAPTQTAPIVHATADGTAIDDMCWGLVPAWAKDVKIGNKAINARVETVAEKPMFRSAFKTRRCLVPANGYFEWKGDAPNKQPYFIHAPDRSMLLFAGLWERWWPVKDAEPVQTFTIVTGPPGLVSGDIHDRAPVILPPALWNDWLTAEPARALELLAAVPEPELTYYPVSKAVGSPRNSTPDLVEPIAA